MTYCLAIRVQQGLIFASDSRTNAGVDYVTVYGKAHEFQVSDRRSFALLSAGNLATTQAVVNELRRDLETPHAKLSLATVDYLFDAAAYVGALSRRIQQEHSEVLAQSGNSAEASFILGGQIKGRPHDIYRIYPEGNYVSASNETPYLQIGENKYGKPILDRLVTLEMTLENAARCAMVSLDSTLRSNISVGLPLDLVFYRMDSFKIGPTLNFKAESPFYGMVQKRWNEGLIQAFRRLPKFEWE